MIIYNSIYNNFDFNYDKFPCQHLHPSHLKGVVAFNFLLIKIVMIKKKISTLLMCTITNITNNLTISENYDNNASNLYVEILIQMNVGPLAQ